MSLSKRVKSPIFKFVASVMILVLGIYLGQHDIITVIVVCYWLKDLFAQWVRIKSSLWFLPMKYLTLVLSISILSSISFLIFYSLGDILTNGLEEDILTYAYLGRIITFSIIGKVVLLGIGYRNYPFECQPEIKQMLVAGMLIILLFFFGNVDRFTQSSFPFEDTLDLIFISCTILCYWYIYLILHHLVLNRLKTKDQWKIKMIRLVLLLLTIIPLDYLFTKLFLNLIYHTSVYSDFWVFEIPLKTILLAIVALVVQQNAGSHINDQVKLRVRSGKTNRFIELVEIRYFHVQYQNVYATTSKGEKLVIDDSLSELEDNLQSLGFFRLNRQVLACREAIESFESMPNRKLRVKLIFTKDFSEFQEVSRLKAPQFRQWINA